MSETQKELEAAIDFQTPVNKLNIYQRINEVRKDVEYIRKDAIVQGYAAVTHDMVTAKLRDSLIKHGILIVPDERFSNVIISGKSAKGNDKIRYEAWYQIDFININDPDDRFNLRIEAHAEDFGDKAPGKCLSYAVKIAMLKVFSLETGESDESRVEDDRRGYTDAQKQGFDDLIAANDSMGLYLLTQEVEEEVYIGLFNSGTKGEKVKLKAKCREMVETGSALLGNVKTAIEASDNALCIESMEGLSHIGEALLRRYFGREGYEDIQNLIKG